LGRLCPNGVYRPKTHEGILETESHHRAAAGSAALSRALALAGDKDLVCVAGSLFIVGEAMAAAAKLPPTG
jgi:folylpolyglutamate synthase/dihydropteroate synthase